MKVETERKGVMRDIHSKGLTIPKNEAYQKYLNNKNTNIRIETLENDISEIKNVLNELSNFLKGKE